VRAVLDPNIIISGVLSSRGAPAQVLRALDRGNFEAIVSRPLLDELRRALAYGKLRARISEDDAAAIVRWLGNTATIAASPRVSPPVRSADPDDDYLIRLAFSERAALISGDKHLLDLAGEIPVFTAREFLAMLAKA
jgi:uncharacterized protein